jgi:hypothetical protein
MYSHSMGDRRNKKLRALFFNNDLLNDTLFIRIHLAGQYGTVPLNLQISKISVIILHLVIFCQLVLNNLGCLLLSSEI